VYHVESYGSVVGVTAMVEEIYARGPIAASIAVPQALRSFSGPGIFCDDTGMMETTHVVEIVGFGVLDG